MKIRKLVVRHFRGIKECDWHIPTDLLCLVGPGDNTKTTLLDAMGLVLSRNYAVHLTDADFHNCDTTEPITITAVVSRLPNRLRTEGELGHWLSGIRQNGRIEPEPLPGTEACIVVRLTVFADLEPVWEIVREDTGEATRISARQRQQLGFFRLGELYESHLRWSRNSALSALSERDIPRATILEAHRVARTSVFEEPPSLLSDVAEGVRTRAEALGSRFQENLRPGLDPSSVSTGNALILHHQDVPLSNFGRGTQRLTSLAIQLSAAEGGSITAIDEVEVGLEPHRLVHLLRSLEESAVESEGQVVLTTHSPIAIQALKARNIWVVRNCNGSTNVTPIPEPVEDMQGTLRSSPTALLSRTVVVCEGATEEGFLREMILHWDTARTEQRMPNSGSLGVVVVNGSGSTVAKRATHFAQLSYRSALLIDHDEPSLQPDVERAVASGVKVFQCSEGTCFEEDFVQSLDLGGLSDFAHFVTQVADRAAIQSRVTSHLNGMDPGLTVSEWEDSDLPFEDIRRAFAKAAAGRRRNGQKDKGWFKWFEGGSELARFFIAHINHFQETPFLKQILALEDWIYESSAV